MATFRDSLTALVCLKQPAASRLSKMNARLSFGMLNLTKGPLLSLLCALFVAAPTVFAQSGVQLNEILASNESFVADDGSLTDWVELVNTTSVPMDLTGASLSDDDL